jgi:hypothetical protein
LSAIKLKLALNGTLAHGQLIPRCVGRAEPEIHRVDPEFGSTLKALIGISSQTAGSTCEFWVNPVNFTFSGNSENTITADGDYNSGAMEAICA